MIYLDNAATGWPRPDAVGRAMADALATCTTPGRGAHPLALEAGRLLLRTRHLAGNLALGGVPAENVVLTSGATQGLNLAIAGLLAPGDHAITTDLEHNSVLRPLYAARARGVEVTVVASERGVVSPDAVSSARRPNTRLIVLTHASNVLGTVQPVEAISADAPDVPVVVDAAQTAGLLTLDDPNSLVAAVALSGHKALLGPPGTGALLLRGPHVPRPTLFGGTGEDSFAETMPDALPAALEAGTPNVPGIAGLRAALQEWAAAGPYAYLAPALARTAELRAGLAATGRVRFPETEAAGVPVLACTLLDRRGEPIDSADAADALGQRDIAVRGGYHCAPLVHRRYAPPSGLVRFSPSHLTTADEISAAVAAVEQITQEA